MIKIERLTRTKVQVVNDAIVSASTGHRIISIFGIRFIDRQFDEDFDVIEDEPEESIGFTKKVKK